jgi:hypothetical protein
MLCFFLDCVNSVSFLCLCFNDIRFVTNNKKKKKKRTKFFFFLIFLFCVKIFKNNGIQFNNLIMRNEKKTIIYKRQNKAIKRVMKSHPLGVTEVKERSVVRVNHLINRYKMFEVVGSQSKKQCEYVYTTACKS